MDGDPPPDDATGEFKRRLSMKGSDTKLMRDADGNPIPTSVNFNDESVNSESFESTNTPKNAMDDKTSSPQFMKEKGKALSDVLNWYPESHKGPFHVLVNPNEVLCKNQRNSELFLYEKLRHVVENKNFVIKNIGYNQYRLTFSSAQEANDFILNESINELNVGVLIPDRFIQKFCIIRNIPVSFTLNDIRSEIEDNNGFDVLSVSGSVDVIPMASLFLRLPSKLV